MNDQQKVRQHLSGSDEIRNVARENSVMRSVVRNVVVNMESVLNDLHGIMGEITTIVDHIDTVTDRIDKSCKVQKESRSQFATKDCHRKRQYDNSSKLNDITLNSLLNPQIDTLMSPEEGYQLSSGNSGHNVLKVNGYSRTKDEEASPLKQLAKLRPHSSEVRFSHHRRSETKLSFPINSFRQFPRDGFGSMSQNGAIAIVYPTIVNNASVEPVNANMEASGIKRPDNFESKAQDYNEKFILQICSKQKNSTASRAQNMLHQIPTEEIKPVKYKMNEERYKKGTTPVYFKYFQPQSPSELCSEVFQITENGSQSERSKGKQSKNIITVADNVEISTISQPAEMDNMTANIQLIAGAERSSMYETSSRKYPTDTFSNVRCSPTTQTWDPIFNSSVLKDWSPKSEKSRIQTSSYSSGSLDSLQRSHFKSCLYSMESGLDSDTAIEYHDRKCATPFIDWSYLNLAGNKIIRDKPTKIIDTNIAPLMHIQGYQDAHLFQTRNDDVVGLSGIIVPPVTSVNRSYMSSPKMHFKDLYGQAGSHIYCSDVCNVTSGEYCGYYENILDSVLENVAGFESFEEACDAIDSIDVLNETYVSFDNEYEEDDWDVGIKSDGHPEYELPILDTRDVCRHQGNVLGSLEVMDKNINILADSSNNFDTNRTSALVYSKTLLVLTRTDAALDNVITEKRINEELSQDDTDFDTCDSLTFSENSENSFHEKNTETNQQPGVSNQNLNLRPKSLTSNISHVCNERIMNLYTAKLETRMPSPDVISCQTVASGSSMSFSSVETIYTSPESDRFENVSDGDDVSSTQDDVNSLSSDTRYGSRMFVHKAKMKKLRRDFFKSLYTACEKPDNEQEHDNELSTAPARCIYLDTSLSTSSKNKDNMSESGSHQENATCYNRNINTWTAYSLMHVQADDMSDSTSDIFNYNNVN